MLTINFERKGIGLLEWVERVKKIATKSASNDINSREIYLERHVDVVNIFL